MGNIPFWRRDPSFLRCLMIHKMLDKEAMHFKYVFGPVPSRRLGRSLGVDLVPHKTCPYDCVYCQLGPTNDKTINRRSYVPVDTVLDEVKQAISRGARPDYITLSGSGEPTLHQEIDKIIEGIKTITKIPVAVLTNGALLWQPEVRGAISGADLVLPSLDAASPEVFKQINHPHPKITLEKVIEGLMAFRREYKGQIWLEIFLVEGINDREEEISKLVELTRKIKPDRIQLNTVTRPPAEVACRAVRAERLQQIAAKFDPPAEIIASYKPHREGDFQGRLQDIVDMCRRRPCTAKDIADAFNLHINEVAKYLGELKESGQIDIKRVDDETYYIAKPA